MNLSKPPSTTRKTVFLLSGQGGQYFQMGRRLYDVDSEFRRQMARLDGVARVTLGYSMVDLLYAADKSRGADFSHTVETHPAIFMVEYALAQALIARGVAPDYLFGSSLGEYVAVTLAGAVDPEQLLERLIRKAQRIERQCPPGMMLTVLHDPAIYYADPLLYRRSTLAGVNYERHFVLSGERDELDSVRKYLQERGVNVVKLPISHGFHSPAIDAGRAVAHETERTLAVGRLQLPLVSCLLGRCADTLPDDYFWQVGRSPILFREALGDLLGRRTETYDFVDIGPAGTLSGFVRQNLRGADESRHRLFPIMSPYSDDHEGFSAVVRQLARVPRASSTSTRSLSVIAYLFPGQGAQKKGMGSELFDRFPELTAQADALLGYSTRSLCVDDPHGQLGQTLYTQPALYVVDALSFLADQASGAPRPDFAAGHSLGEYVALFASGMVDFATGLRLVQRRATLMSQAQDGAMAAVIGLEGAAIRAALAEGGFANVDLANLNSPSQIVISGARAEVLAARPKLEALPGCSMVMPLAVSGAFHSRLMEPARREFEAFLAGVSFAAPAFPVISNVTARPYTQESAAALLASQITEPVNWVESVRYLWGRGVAEFRECGPGAVLTGLVNKIKAESTPLVVEDAAAPAAPATPAAPLARSDNVIALNVARPAPAPGLHARSLGSAQFRADYQVDYAYVAGAMVHGIASADLVIRMGRAGMLSYFGTGGLAPAKVEQAIGQIQAALAAGQPYGMNLLNGSREQENVDLFLKYGVRNIEASAYMQITPGLVLYRLRGLELDGEGQVRAANRIMAKLSRPEIAAAFLQPAPARLVAALLEQGLVTAEQAQWASRMPMADDICVEADSGGHTDSGVTSTLLPAIIRQRDAAMAEHAYRKMVRVGSAGGIGTPDAAAVAFMLGADFIMTGSINQCTVEAGTSDLVKDLLQEVQVQDTDYAPAGDMFEIGSRVQVLKRGIFFPVRANKLYEVYRGVDGLEQIEPKTATLIQDKYFQRSFAEVFEECRRYHKAEQIELAQQNPKKKMAMVFRWYFAMTNRFALAGDATRKVDFQIHCGPALGGFNQWVKESPLESWRERHVDEIGLKLMTDTADLLRRRCSQMLANDTEPAADAARRAAD